jgi:hypothetical protein
MLTRISEGRGGWREYLEEGRIDGLSSTHNDRDKRVVLDGDIDLTGLIIKSMNNKGGKYLHFSLFFREDFIDDETLRSIVSDFKLFFFSAYEPEEFNSYAEAHLPRIKSYVSEKTGKTIDRRIVVHILTPKVNLVTWRSLNPIGWQNIKFLDAWQEITNQKYGLSSPKDNRRLGFSSGSGAIESRQPAAELEATVAEWHKVRAREIKYLNSGSKIYRDYRAAGPDEKKRILDACELQHRTKCDLINANWEIKCHSLAE